MDTKTRSDVRLIVFCAAAIATASCATERLKPLNGSALRATQPRTIVVVPAKTPDFVARTRLPYFWWIFGPIGIALSEASMHASGISLVQRHAIGDPASTIAAEVAKALSWKYALQEVHGDNIPARGPRQARLAVASRDADLVLDVETYNWGLGPSGTGRYDVRYAGTMKLIDGRNGATLAEGWCTAPRTDPHTTPTYNQMVADRSALLKVMLASTAESCVDEFRTKIIGVY